jgi:hypothetical protein
MVKRIILTALITCLASVRLRRSPAIAKPWARMASRFTALLR